MCDGQAHPGRMYVIWRETVCGRHSTLEAPWKVEALWQSPVATEEYTVYTNSSVTFCYCCRCVRGSIEGKSHDKERGSDSIGCYTYRHEESQNMRGSRGGWSTCFCCHRFILHTIDGRSSFPWWWWWKRNIPLSNSYKCTRHIATTRMIRIIRIVIRLGMVTSSKRREMITMKKKCHVDRYKNAWRSLRHSGCS